MIQKNIKDKSRKIVKIMTILLIIIFCSINLFSASSITVNSKYNTYQPQINSSGGSNSYDNFYLVSGNQTINFTSFYDGTISGKLFHDAISYNGVSKVDGKHNKGVHIDDIDDYIDLETGVFSDTTITEFTIQGWIKLDTIYHDEPKTIFYEGGDTLSAPLIWLFISESSTNNDLSLGCYGDLGLEYIYYDFNPESDTWYNVAVVFNNGNVNYYIDGVNVLNETFANCNSVSKRRFRQHKVGVSLGTDRLYGSLDDLRVWERTLSESEINNEMDSYSIVNPENSRLSYSFEEGPETTTIYDTQHIVETEEPKIFNSTINGEYISKGMYFDGVDDYLTTNNLILSEDIFSICGYIIPGSDGTIYSSKDNISSGISLEVSNDLLLFNYNELNISYPSQDEFSFCAISNSTHLNLYINNSLVNSTTKSGTISTSTIGKVGTINYGIPSNFYNGTIADLKIYSRDLLASEITDYYNGELLNITNLSLHYTFDMISNELGIEDKSYSGCAYMSSCWIKLEPHTEGLYTIFGIDNKITQYLDETFYIDRFEAVQTEFQEPIYTYTDTINSVCEDLYDDFDTYSTTYLYNWTKNGATVLSGTNETILNVSTYLENDIIALNCDIISEYSNYSFTQSATIIDPEISVKINDKSSVDFALSSNTETIFTLQITQNSSDNQAYTLADNINPTYGNITFNETSFNLSSTSIKYIKMNLSTGLSLVNNSIFYITLTRQIDNKIINLTFDLSVVENSAILTISPTTTWSSTFTKTSSIQRTFTLLSTGYSATNCSFSATELNINNSLNSSIGNNFNLLNGVEKNATITISGLNEGLYTGTIIYSCANASSLQHSSEVIEGVDFIFLVQIPTPSGGGGGGGATIDLNGDKQLCDIGLSIEEIFLDDNIIKQSISILNNEDFGYDPELSFEYISGDEVLINKLRQTNIIEFIDTDKQSVTGVRLSSPIPVGEAKGNIIISSTKCTDIKIPIQIKITQETGLVVSLEELVSRDISIEDKIKDLSQRYLYFESPFTSVLGLTIIMFIIFGFTEIPTSKKQKREFKKSAGRYIFVSITTTIILTIIVFIILFIWQSNLL